MAHNERGAILCTCTHTSNGDVVIHDTYIVDLSCMATSSLHIYRIFVMYDYVLFTYLSYIRHVLLRMYDYVLFTHLSYIRHVLLRPLALACVHLFLF